MKVETVIVVEWHKRQRQRVAHAYRKHRGRLLGSCCQGNVENGKMLSADKEKPGSLVSYGEVRCVTCQVIVGRINSTEGKIVSEVFTDIELQNQSYQEEP